MVSEFYFNITQMQFSWELEFVFFFFFNEKDALGFFEKKNVS